MNTLIICIDRDNDVGVKAKIPSPIIGRDANLQAAISLGLADPEDSDTNSMFGAVKLYERLRSQGEDVEVVTLAGDTHVGVESDRKVMEQLKNVLAKTKAKEAILVTDGAEDEGLLTLIQSRIEVVGLERIIVKQERKIEGIYYFIQKSLEDEKMRRVVIPIAFILMAWGISLFFGLERGMQGFIVFMVGAYLLLKTYHLEGDVINIFTDISDQVKAGKFSWVFTAFSIILFVFGFFRAIDALRNDSYYESSTSFIEITFFIYILIIMKHLIVWCILALLVKEWGNFFDIVITGGTEDSPPVGKSYWSTLNISIFLIATGLFFRAGLDIVQAVADPDSIVFSYESTIVMIIIGIAFFVGGRQIYGLRIEEEEVMKEKHRILRLKRKKKISGWRH